MLSDGYQRHDRLGKTDRNSMQNRPSYTQQGQRKTSEQTEPAFPTSMPTSLAHTAGFVWIFASRALLLLVGMRQINNFCDKACQSRSTVGYKFQKRNAHPTKRTNTASASIAARTAVLAKTNMAAVSCFPYRILFNSQPNVPTHQQLRNRRERLKQHIVHRAFA